MTSETSAIPQSVRSQVDIRDKGICRFCGKFLGFNRRAIHHIRFGGDAQGMGGRRDHALDNLLTVCWLPGDNDCHGILHKDKPRWMELALEVAIRSGITVLQLERWQKRALKK
jgi:5-methylcytosine-specific restriction endonuclease McrA